MGHFFVPQFDHRFLDTGLGLDQFEFEFGPVAAHAELEQAVGVGREALPYGKTLGLPEQGAPDLLDEALLFGHHGKEPVADERAEIQGSLEAVAVGAFEIRLGEELDRNGLEEFQFVEEALDGGRGQLVHAEFLAGVGVGEYFRRSLLVLGADAVCGKGKRGGEE